MAIIIFVPHLIFVLLNQSSPTIGLLVVFFLLLPLFLLPSFRPLLKIDVKALIVLFVFVFVFFLHSIISTLYFEAISLKIILSLLLFLLLLLYAIALGNAYRMLRLAHIYELLNIYLVLSIVIGWVGLLFGRWIPIYNYLPHPVFPFSEPSHYALAVSMFLPANIALSNYKLKIFYLFNFSLLAILFPNLTLMLVVLLALFFGVNIKLHKKIIFMTLSLLLIYLVVNLESGANIEYLTYLKSRLAEFSVASTNTSTLVYIQGWDDLNRAINDTHGWGLGFQRMGLQEPSELSALIFKIAGGYLNREDGGFLFSKFVSEFGFLAVIFVLLVVIQMISFRKAIFRKINMGADVDEITKERIALVISCSFLIEFFFRGYGYFTANVMIFIAMQIFIFSRKGSFII